MHHDAGAVDEQPVRDILDSDQRVEHVISDAALGPSHQAVVERLLRIIYLEVGAVGLPHLVGRGGLGVESIGGLDHHIGRAGDQIMGLQQAVS